MDNYLDGIEKLIRERRANLNCVNFFLLKIGDKVKFINSVRPKYLAGREGVFREHLNKKVVIDLIEPCGRFSKNITTQVQLIEKV